MWGTPVVGFDPGGREVQPCGGGAASRGEQHGVPDDFVFSACLCVGHGDPDAPGGVAHRFDPRAYAEFDALFFQRLPYGGRNVAVFARDQLRKPYIEANSSPMYPPPTITRCCGSSSSSMIEVLV